MKTILEEATRQELVTRITGLSPAHNAQWGKMDVVRMVKHCVLWNHWVQGTAPFAYKQEWLGKIFGRMALRSTVSNDKPLGKNVPAGKAFTIKDGSGDLSRLKQTWIEQIGSYASYSNPHFIHDFFGHMTTEQIGIFVFKHTDHHLRQFGA